MLEGDSGLVRDVYKLRDGAVFTNSRLDSGRWRGSRTVRLRKKAGRERALHQRRSNGTKNRVDDVDTAAGEIFLLDKHLYLKSQSLYCDRSMARAARRNDAFDKRK